MRYSPREISDLIRSTLTLSKRRLLTRAGLAVAFLAFLAGDWAAEGLTVTASGETVLDVSWAGLSVRRLA